MFDGGESEGLAHPDRPVASGQLDCGVGLNGLVVTITKMLTYLRFESQLFPCIDATRTIQSRGDRFRKPMR
jgi:hypothetical protein